MNAEKRMELMATARLVNVAWDAIKPLIDTQRAAAVNRLTADFRASKEPRELYQHIAVLVVLEDFEAQVKGKLRAGEQAAKETME